MSARTKLVRKLHEYIARSRYRNTPSVGNTLHDYSGYLFPGRYTDKWRIVQSLKGLQDAVHLFRMFTITPSTVGPLTWN